MFIYIDKLGLYVYNYKRYAVRQHQYNMPPAIPMQSIIIIYNRKYIPMYRNLISPLSRYKYPKLIFRTGKIFLSVYIRYLMQRIYKRINDKYIPA